MKKILENKKLLAIIIGVILLVIIGIISLVLINNKPSKKEDNKVQKEEIHTMYVKINPLVKLTYKETFYKCKDKEGKDTLCADGTGTVMGYELINDDAKEFYKDLDFNGKYIGEVLLMLCETARDNNVGFESLEITTDSEHFNKEEMLDYLKDNSKYEFSYDIYVNFEEHIDEDEIVKDEEINNKFLVNFNSDGGSKVESQTVNKGDKASRPSDPVKEGYDFVEWQLDGKTFDFNTPITKDITLEALWKQKEIDKDETTDKKEEKPVDPTPEKPTEDSKPSKTPSSISKINLNDNILVQVIYSGTMCGWKSFATNLETLFPGYVKYQGIELGELTEYNQLPFEEYYSKESQIQYDINKENTAVNELNALKKQKIPGLNGLEYSLENHHFKYSYDYLVIYYENENPFEELNNYLMQGDKKIKDIFKDAYSLYGGCGTGPDEPQLLTQKLCSEYNLTCDRW